MALGGNGEPLRGAIVIVLTSAGIILSVHQLFNLQMFGLVLLEGRYLYLLASLFLPVTYMCFPAQGRPGGGWRWLDAGLAGLSVAAAGYFAWTAEVSLLHGWEYDAPAMAVVAAFTLWLLILEAARRTAGLALFAVVAVFSLYPTFADAMPGPIAGFSQSLPDTVAFHIISAESAFGIPMRAFGTLVIGFILFGVVLHRTGGATFFNNLALALVGGFRGGAAKVAIFASGFMASMSGSVISNVLTTGPVSIPAMQRTGFSARYAAATEACASTGGVLMPPIMGATAFVMASFLARPYYEVALAAVIPALLYYFGLFVQLDAYAARRQLQGLARAELPSLLATLRQGWMYLFVFALLIVLLVVYRMDTLAPFYATGLLVLINQLLPGRRLSWRGLAELVSAAGRALAELVAILLAVGLIVGAFSATGLAGTLVNDLVFLAGGSTAMLLIMGGATAFVFGMGMTVTACYIFLAVVLAPALIQGGIDPLAAHLFILYYGMVSYITPPVALGAFSAATLAQSPQMATSLEAMRLGAVIYVVPVFFVLNPALIGQGAAGDIALALATALLGVWFFSAALQGHVSLLGPLGHSIAGGLARLALLCGGLVLAVSGLAVGMGHAIVAALGVVAALPALIAAWHNGTRAGR